MDLTSHTRIAAEAAAREPAGAPDGALLRGAMAADLHTPSYLFRPDKVLESHARLKAALGTGLVVSLKANPNLDLFIRTGHAFADGVEVASIKELDVVVGRLKGPKFVNNPSLDAEFIRAAKAAKATFIVDNPAQWDLLDAHGALEREPQLLLRLNAAALLSHDGAAQRARIDHFGMAPQTALELARAARARGIRILGLHVFAGSHSFEKLGCALADAAWRFAQAFEAELGHEIVWLNLGGGFSAGSVDDAAAFERYRARLAQIPARIRVLHESGRGIFGHCGAFVVRVVATKMLGERRVVVCDGGISHNFLQCRTESPLARRQAPVLCSEHVATPGAVPLCLVGASCSQADVLCELPAGSPEPRPGDRYVFLDAGAYHATYTPVNFLSAKPSRHYIL